MDMLDSLLVVAALIAAAVLPGWFAAQPQWQRFRTPRALEMWRFAARRGSTGKTQWDMSHAAEIRCALCTLAPQCAKRLAAGCDLPEAQCPNARER